MSSSEKSGLRLLAAAALSLLLSACGFQLRGEAATGLKSLHVPGGGVAQEIRRTLARSPTRVEPTAEAAEAYLRILSENRDKSVNTITGSSAPSPVVIDRPAVLARVIVPLVAVKVILISFAPRSGSATEI